MKRREFNKLAGLGALAMHSFPAISPATLFAAEPNQLPRVPLGVCDHALRAMKPTADQVLDYAIERGGHAAVGLGDYPFSELGEGAPTNAEVVAAVVEIAKRHGREIATPEETRAILLAQ